MSGVMLEYGKNATVIQLECYCMAWHRCQYQMSEKN